MRAWRGRKKRVNSLSLIEQRHLFPPPLKHWHFCFWGFGLIPKLTSLPEPTPKTNSQVFSCCWCSVSKLCPTLCDPRDCGTSGFPVLHSQSVEIHARWVGDAIQPSHPLSPPSHLALNFPQHQGLFQWVGSSHEVAEELEFQLQHQFFQWIFRVDFP